VRLILLIVFKGRQTPEIDSKSRYFIADINDPFCAKNSLDIRRVVMFIWVLPSSCDMKLKKAL